MIALRNISMTWNIGVETIWPDQIANWPARASGFGQTTAGAQKRSRVAAASIPI
jgi:hypothetical protein